MWLLGYEQPVWLLGYERPVWLLGYAAACVVTVTQKVSLFIWRVVESVFSLLFSLFLPLQVPVPRVKEIVFAKHCFCFRSVTELLWATTQLGRNLT